MAEDGVSRVVCGVPPQTSSHHLYASGSAAFRTVVSVAILAPSVHSVVMPYRPRKSKKPDAKGGVAGSSQSRDHQFLDQRRRDFTTRNTLARLRNRKSDLK
jgi:hypothetical protein